MTLVQHSMLRKKRHGVVGAALKAMSWNFRSFCLVCFATCIAWRPVRLRPRQTQPGAGALRSLIRWGREAVQGSRKGMSVRPHGRRAKASLNRPERLPAFFPNYTSPGSPVELMRADR